MELWSGEEVVGKELEAFDAVAEEVSIRESGNEAREVIRDGRVSWRWGFWWGDERERRKTGLELELVYRHSRCLCPYNYTFIQFLFILVVFIILHFYLTLCCLHRSLLCHCRW